MNFTDGFGDVRDPVTGGPERGPDPQEWLARAKKQQGTWWTHWVDWLNEHGGEQIPAPKSLGSTAHPAREPAPGLYVRDQLPSNAPLRGGDPSREHVTRRSECAAPAPSQKTLEG